MAASLAWMLAMSQRKIHDCPSLARFSTSSKAVVSSRIVVVVAQPFSDVTFAVRRSFMSISAEIRSRLMQSIGLGQDQGSRQ